MTAARSAIRFLSRATVIGLHRESLAFFGGIDGIRDAGLLESALHRCVNRASDEPDVSIPRLAASLAFGLAMNHPFSDGNKRIAMMASFTLAELNGLRIEADEVEAYEVFIDLVAGQVTEDELAAWFESVCG